VGGHKNLCGKRGEGEMVELAEDFPMHLRFPWSQDRLQAAIDKYACVYSFEAQTLAIAVYELKWLIGEQGEVDMVAWRASIGNCVITFHLELHDGEGASDYRWLVPAKISLWEDVMLSEQGITFLWGETPRMLIHSLLAEDWNAEVPKILTPGQLTTVVLEPTTLIAMKDIGVNGDAVFKILQDAMRHGRGRTTSANDRQQK
jgi:hypothetical protein